MGELPPGQPDAIRRLGIPRPCLVRAARPLDPHDDWEEWKALLAEAGITKDARLHDARHTAGALLGSRKLTDRQTRTPSSN